jgi:putative nucleotidyltransferase with HDIG domain
MRFDTTGLLPKLWLMGTTSSVMITLIYFIADIGFDLTFYKLITTLCLGFLPLTLFYRKLSQGMKNDLLFINTCVVIILLGIFIPFNNHIEIIFLPLIATLYKNRKVFYFISGYSIIHHLLSHFLNQDASTIESLIEISYLNGYLFFLGLITNILIRTTRKEYMFSKTVKTLLLAIETKDIYTRGHSIRVSDYSMIIGEYMKKKGYNIDLDILKVSSLIHDIGKIYVPHDVLTKSGRLTSEEYKSIQKHSEFGARLAKELEYPEQIVEDILYHHERFDGKGYPKGLKGNEIPLHSRIIALADTFDAVTTTRSYRKAFTVEEAKKIILESSHTQFDPIMIEVFHQVYTLLVEYFELNSNKMKNSEWIQLMQIK